jgi:putative membrane protein
MSEDKPSRADDLALQRTVMASTRTFMAWTRTALSLISFGFSIPKVLEYANPAKMARTGDWGPRTLGTILIFLGVFVLAVSAFDHWKLVRGMRKNNQHMKFSSNRLSFVVALVLTVLGALALVNIIFQAGPL